MSRVLIVASVASMIEQFNMPNIRLLLNRGVKVEVATHFSPESTFSPERNREFYKELESLGVIVHNVPFSRRISNLKNHIRALKMVLEITKKEKIDFIHAHSPIGGVVARIAGKINGVKVIYTAHGFHFYKGSSVFSWLTYYPSEKILSYFTDTLITINKEDYNLAQKKFHAKHIRRIPGVGVDTDQFQKTNSLPPAHGEHKKIRFISVGELNRNKNHILVINALSTIHNFDFEYVICGRGKLEDYLKSEAEKKHLKDRLILKGYQKNIKELLSDSDIFIFPSKREGLSLALMEAMAAGLPVICTDIRGNNELIEDGVNGFLIQDGEVEKLKHTIISLCEDEELRSQMALNNLKKVQQYDIKRINLQMDQIYTETLGLQEKELKAT